MPLQGGAFLYSRAKATTSWITSASVRESSKKVTGLRLVCLSVLQLVCSSNMQHLVYRLA
jgi:hypothetical protein